MDSERTEYVSMQVTKKVALAIKELDDGHTKESVILQFIKDCKKDLQTEIESVDEDVLIFRGVLAKARQAFQQTRDEYLDSSYKIWEDSDKKLPIVKDKIQKLTNQLNPLKKELDEINKVLKSIDTFNIEKLVKFIKFLLYEVFK